MTRSCGAFNNVVVKSEATVPTGGCSPQLSVYSWGVVLPSAGYYTLCRPLATNPSAFHNYVNVSVSQVGLIPGILSQSVVVSANPSPEFSFTGDWVEDPCVPNRWNVYFMGRGGGVPYLYVTFKDVIAVPGGVSGVLGVALVGDFESAAQGLATTISIFTGYASAYVSVLVLVPGGIGKMTIGSTFVVSKSLGVNLR